ncbi:MAG: hypothetical protein AAF789_09290, partial [Bacteroidota bacterium]
MKKVGIFVAVIMMAMAPLLAQKRAIKRATEDMKNWKYEIECVGTGKPGTYLVKVWSYSTKPVVALNQGKKNAIHAIIFKGFSGGGRGCTSQKPLTQNTNLAFENEEFFDDFFDEGGPYLRFVNQTTDTSLTPVKLGTKKKDGYKVPIVVNV